MRLWIFYLATTLTALSYRRQRYAARRAYAGHGRHGAAGIEARRQDEWFAAINRMYAARVTSVTT